MDLPIRGEQNPLKMQTNVSAASPANTKSSKSRKYRDVLGKPKMESSTLDLTETSAKSSPRDNCSNFQSLSSPINPKNNQSYSSVTGIGPSNLRTIKNFDLPDDSLGSLANSINVMNLTNQIQNDDTSENRKQELSIYLKKLLKKEEEKILAGDYGTDDNFNDDDQERMVKVKSPTIRPGGDTDNEIRSDVKA